MSHWILFEIRKWTLRIIFHQNQWLFNFAHILLCKNFTMKNNIDLFERYKIFLIFLGKDLRFPPQLLSTVVYSFVEYNNFLYTNQIWNHSENGSIPNISLIWWSGISSPSNPPSLPRTPLPHRLPPFYPGPPKTNPTTSFLMRYSRIHKFQPIAHSRTLISLQNAGNKLWA